MEKEKERERNNSEKPEEKEIECEVNIHLEPMGKIKVNEGSLLSDVIEKLQRENDITINLKEYKIRLNDRDIEVDANGDLKENPVLTENCVLSLLKELGGGK